jgi:plasmid stability protein
MLLPASAEARPTKAVRLDLDADLHKRLRMAAADKSMTAYARDVIERHLRGEKKTMIRTPPMTPNDLRGRAALMRSQLPPPPAGGGPPQDLGHRLLTLPRGQDEELRLCLDAYEGRPFLNVRIWTRDTAGRGWWG